MRGSPRFSIFNRIVSRGRSPSGTGRQRRKARGTWLRGPRTSTSPQFGCLGVGGALRTKPQPPEGDVTCLKGEQGSHGSETHQPRHDGSMCHVGPDSVPRVYRE